VKCTKLCNTAPATKLFSPEPVSILTRVKFIFFSSAYCIDSTLQWFLLFNALSLLGLFMVMVVIWLSVVLVRYYNPFFFLFKVIKLVIYLLI
jgi:hypothetical protein